MKKPKIAIYYSVAYGRNDGPPLFYFEQLKKIFGKDNVDHLDPTGPELERNGPYDFHFMIDWGDDAVLGKKEALKDMIPHDGGKRIYVISDAHLDDGYRFEKAHQFDYVYFNQKYFIDQYIGRKATEIEKGGTLLGWHKFPGQHIAYLPHAAEPVAYPHYDIIKKYDICFIGHLQETHKDNTLNMSRIDVLDKVFEAIPNFYFGSRMAQYPGKNMFEDASKKFCQSKVVFNISIGNDANMRFFEALVSGSFLLTNWIPELKNLEQYGFIDGVHYISYKSLDEAIRKAKTYIKLDKEREKIAEAGYKQALKTGTYESRIREIFEKVGVKLPTQPKSPIIKESNSVF